MNNEVKTTVALPQDAPKAPKTSDKAASTSAAYFKPDITFYGYGPNDPIETSNGNDGIYLENW